MAERGKYNTKQYDEIFEYLKRIPEKHVTVADLMTYFQGKGKNIGTATLYRNLEKMVDEGKVNKYFIDQTSPACYQFLDPETHNPEEATCYHCRCEVCGKLIHMRCEEIEEFRAHLLLEHKFHIDPMRTVFYGICDDCSGTKKIVVK